MKKRFTAVLAIMLCVVFVFAGCKQEGGNVVDESDPQQNIVDNNAAEGNLKSDVKIQEGETAYETTLGKGAAAFINSTYYIDGVIYSAGNAMPVKLATDGKNLQLTTDMSEISIGVLMLDDAAYMIEPNSKKYTELSDTLLKLLDFDDMNVSELQQIKNSGTDADNQANQKQINVTINGKPGICNEFVFDDALIKLYSIGDELVQVENYDENNNLSMQIVVNSITEQIPADQLTLKGLSKVNAASFLKAITDQVQQS